MPDIRKHIELSQKLEYNDLDWDLAAKIGLAEQEKEILPYFADIEGQTIFYLLEVLKLKASRDPDTIAFATIWNYEEYFHGDAIGKLLEVCGCPLARDRVTTVRVGARLQARVEDWAQIALSRLFPRSFITLWMAWGASQEILTLAGYERLAETTRNPVLRDLCLRIAKQERRHFAWYYNAARERLAESRFAQRFVRAIFERFWTPVGAGVKSRREVAGLVANLFPGRLLPETMIQIDARMARLPGMKGFDVMASYAAGIQELLPLEARYLELPPETAVAQ